MISDLIDASCADPSFAKYHRGACRCPGCREAHRAYYIKRRKYYAAVEQGAALSTLVDAAPVRAKVRSLMEVGYTEDEIARVSGVSKSTVHNLLKGSPKTGEPLKRVRRTTKDAICSIRGRRHLRENTRVDATLMADHVREWSEAMPVSEIAELLGVGKTVVYELLRGKEKVAAKVFYAYIVNRGRIWRIARARKATSTARSERKVACLETGEVFESLEAAAASTGAKRSEIRRSIETAYDTRGRHWHYADEPKPDSAKLKSHRMPVVCVETGEVFETCAAATKAIGMKHNAVSQGIRRGHAVGGFHWELA